MVIFGFKLPNAINAGRAKIFLIKYDSFSVVLIDFVIFNACPICCTVDIDIDVI